MEFILHGKGSAIAAKDAAPKTLSVSHTINGIKEDLLFVVDKGPKLKMRGDDVKLYGYALEYLRRKNLEDKFFQLYKEAKNAGFVMITGPDEKTNTLRYLLGKALEDLLVSDIETFLIEHKEYDSFIRSTIKVELNTVSISDGEGTAAQTYTRDDYIGLVAILIQQQLLFPIYTDFLTIGAGGKKNPLEKPTELTVLMLQESLDVIRNNPAIHRLLSYIAEHLTSLSGGNTEKALNIATYFKVTDDELPRYVLGRVLTKLLPVHQPVCRVNGKDAYKDIATDIFSVIKNIMTESAEKTPNKINPQEAYHGEGKDSIFESNQFTTNISQADEAMILVSMETNTKADLVNILHILFDEYGIEPTKEDIIKLHEHRAATDDFRIEELNIWLISIFSCVLLPSKFLGILGPKEIYNLNSLIYTLVCRLLGEEYGKFYSVRFKTLPDTIVLTGADNLTKEDLERLRKFYPIMLINSKGVGKPVVALWITKLKDSMRELGFINAATNRPLKIKNLKDSLVDLLVASVELKR